MILFSFATEETVRNWHPQNDVVMGGVSSSEMTHASDTDAPGGAARFGGDVSLERGGGFAQVLHDDTMFDLTGFHGIELLVRGDGRTYQLRLRTDAARVSYARSFVAPDEWRRVRLPFADFEATFRGRDVPDAPELDPATIRSVGFLIADRQAGAFELLIGEVSAYRE